MTVRSGCDCATCGKGKNLERSAESQKSSLRNVKNFKKVEKNLVTSKILSNFAKHFGLNVAVPATGRTNEAKAPDENIERFTIDK